MRDSERYIYIYIYGCPQNVGQDYGIGFRVQKGRKPCVMNMGGETLPCRVITEYSRTPVIRINLDDDPSGYAENSDNFDFSLKIGYIGSLEMGDKIFYERLF